MVTGGLGFVGSHLVKRVTSEGFEVCVFDKMGVSIPQGPRGIKNKKGESLAGTPNVAFFQGDIANWLHVDRVFANLGNKQAGRKVVSYISYIFHLAGSAKMDPRFTDEVFKSNILGVYNVLCAARKYNVHKVIFASSAAVYGDAKVPHSENSHCYPKNFYAMSKAVGESLCMIFTKMGWADTTILRLFNVYGPGQKGTGKRSPIIPAILCALSGECGLVIFGDGKQTRDFVYVDDVAEAFFLAREARAGTIYNVGSGKAVTIHELVKEVSKRWGAKPDVEFDSGSKNEVRHSLADIKKIQESLGWTPRTSLGEGLDRTIQWWKGGEDG